MKKSITSTNVTAMCCVPKGKVDICSYFERSDYTPGEQANIIAEIDNSGCKADVKTIDGVFKQILRLTAGTYTKHIKLVLNKVKINGVRAGETKTGDNSVRISVSLKDQKTGKPVQATCKGKLIDNRYVLETVTKMDATICCKAHPTASIPANIFNRAFEE